jgi:hypothetical protein
MAAPAMNVPGLYSLAAAAQRSAPKSENPGSCDPGLPCDLRHRHASDQIVVRSALLRLVLTLALIIRTLLLRVLAILTSLP